MKSSELKQEAKELLIDFLEKKKVSKVKLARKIGVSNSVLTYVTQEQWENVSEEMMMKIVNALKMPGENYKLVETGNFNTIQTMCRCVARWHQMCGLIGFTGAGKTTALKSYYRSNPNVYYVECKSYMNNRQFFRSVSNELGVNCEGSLCDILESIAAAFKTKESPLLIIDEVGKLSHRQILVLHDLRNATDNNLGIILSGCDYFRENLEKGVKRDKTGIPEFYGRISSWQALSSPSKAEAMAIFESNGICDEGLKQRKYENFREIYGVIVSAQIARQIQLESLTGETCSQE
ncbi:MAG: AAA family ATPase [Dysgonamonadaceae bacterium]|jgi:DNA transposition AAA+ family ATPase|nr:AAA family ATPase [Dysgonamonadaceae bacterium]